MTDLTRLTTLVKNGDTDAAQHLLVDARRLGDVELCMESCRVLVGAGEWRQPLEYYQQRVESIINGACKFVCDRPTEDCVGCSGSGIKRPPIDCHDLCNAILLVHRRQADAGHTHDKYGQESWDLYWRAVDLWWPGNTDYRRDYLRDHGWLAPECICLDAGVERGRCPSKCTNNPDNRPRPLHFFTGSVLPGKLIKECPTCNGSGRCPRCDKDDSFCVCLGPFNVEANRGRCAVCSGDGFELVGDGTFGGTEQQSCSVCDGTGRCQVCGHPDWSDLETLKQRSQDGHYVYGE